MSHSYFSLINRSCRAMASHSRLRCSRIVILGERVLLGSIAVAPVRTLPHSHGLGWLAGLRFLHCIILNGSIGIACRRPYPVGWRIRLRERLLLRSHDLRDKPR